MWASIATMAGSEASLKYWTDCRGTLSLDSSVVEIVCEITCSNTGKLRVSVEPLPFNLDSFWLHQTTLCSTKHSVTHVTLDVTTPDGHVLQTPHAYITRVQLPEDVGRDVVQIDVRAQTLTWKPFHPPAARPAEKVTVVYRTMGVKGDGDGSLPVDEGTLRYRVSRESDSSQGLTGYLRIESKGSPKSLDDFIGRCDRRIDPILRVLSLSQGRFIKWSIREVFIDDKFQCAYFRDTRDADPEIQAALSDTDLASVLELAVLNYGRKFDCNTGVLEAIEWLMMYSRYAEMRFLATTTAFEHLVSKRRKSAGALFPTEVFDDIIRPAVEAALENTELKKSLHKALEKTPTNATLENAEPSRLKVNSEELLRKLCLKLRGVNQGTYRNRLDALLTKYEVPIDDFPLGVGEFIKIRNSLVHRGHSKALHSKYSLTEITIMWQELLRRTILRILGYNGQYLSWLHHQETKRLPDRNDTIR